jgi:ribosomal protein S14
VSDPGAPPPAPEGGTAGDVDYTCSRCGEPDSASELGGLCRDCLLDELAAKGSCRECLRWIMREEYGGPRAQQHLPGCSLAEGRGYTPRNREELMDVLRRNGSL